MSRPSSSAEETGWLPARPPGTVSCGQAEAWRAREVWLILGGGCLSLGMTGVLLLATALPAAVLFGTTGAGMLLAAASRARLRHGLRRCYRYWHQEPAATVFVPPVGPALGEHLFIGTTVTNSLAVLSTVLLTDAGAFYPGNSLAVRAALVFVAAGIASWPLVPLLVPGRPVIVLTSEGVRLWPGRRGEAWIPWDHAPCVAGISRFGGKASILTLAGTTLRFPMYYLPLGYAHLHRILHHYSTHPHHRHELATPHGPNRIHTLARTSPDHVEETPNDQTPRPAPETTNPAPTTSPEER